MTGVKGREGATSGWSGAQARFDAIFICCRPQPDIAAIHNHLCAISIVLLTSSANRLPVPPGPLHFSVEQCALSLPARSSALLVYNLFLLRLCAAAAS